MHAFKVLSISFALIFCIFMLYGCGSDEKGDLSMRFYSVTNESQSEPQPESTISLSVDKLDLDHYSGTGTIQIKSNCDWSISFRESSNNKETKEIDWIKAEPPSGTGDCEVTLTFEDNNTLKSINNTIDDVDRYHKIILEDEYIVDDRFCELVVTSESRTIATALIKQEGITVDNIRVEDKIEFGRYPQSADGDIDDPNTYESLIWIVISVDRDNNNDVAIDCIAEKIIDNKIKGNSCWYGGLYYDSELVCFLNTDFYTKAFTIEEQKMLFYSLMENTIVYIPYYYKLMNFSQDDLRRCKPTEYAIVNGLVISDNGYSPYWLYDKTSDIDGKAISEEGTVYIESVQNKLGVRPEITLMYKLSN